MASYPYAVVPEGRCRNPHLCVTKTVRGKPLNLMRGQMRRRAAQASRRLSEKIGTAKCINQFLQSRNSSPSVLDDVANAIAETVEGRWWTSYFTSLIAAVGLDRRQNQSS